MKTDSQLKRDVEAELAWDPAVNEAAIGVAVKDGVVTLSGHLNTYVEKYAAEKALRRVAGVKAIALEIDVRVAPGHQRSDTDIASSIEQSLRWNVVVPADRVRVTVDKGWVNLRGELDWDFQRQAIEKAVRPVAGVVGISNEMTLKARVAPADVQKRIADALARQAAREAGRMNVSIEASTVRLKGKVNSWHERAAAEGAAWSAPGVLSVVNDLEID